MRKTMLACFAGLAMAALPALAKTPPPKTPTDAPRAAAAREGATAGDAAAADAPQAARPFVEASLVLAPRQVGPWTLVSANDYPGDPASGAGFRYAHRDHPDVRVDLFVYLVGRLVGEDVDKELDAQIQVVRQGVEQGVAQGSYDSAAFEAPVPAWLPPPATDVAGVDIDVDADADADADPDAKAIEAALLEVLAQDEAKDRRIPGRKLALELGWNLTPVSSRGYVYYRGLYFYKGRVSASHVTMPTAALDAFADEAMAALVPAFRVNSTGGCAASTIYVDSKADAAEASRQLVAGALAAQARAEAERCAPVLEDEVPEGFRAVRLDYPSEFWTSP